MLCLKNFKISKFKIKEKVLLYICQTIFFRKNDKTFLGNKKRLSMKHVNNIIRFLIIFWVLFYPYLAFLVVSSDYYNRRFIIRLVMVPDEYEFLIYQRDNLERVPIDISRDVVDNVYQISFEPKSTHNYILRSKLKS